MSFSTFTLLRSCGSCYAAIRKTRVFAFPSRFNVCGRTLTSESAAAPAAGTPHVMSLLSKLKDKYGSKFEHRLLNLDVACKYLVDCGASADTVTDMFLRQPALGEMPLHRWSAVVDVLKFLPTDTVVSLIAACPQIVTVATQKQLLAALNVLRRANFDSKQLAPLLARAPMLLVTSPSYIVKRFQQLQGLITQDSLCHVLLACPNLLLDDWEAIEETIRYATYSIGCDQRQLIDTKLLRYPADHIELRHQLMIRTGQLKKLQLDKGISNAHLAKMVDPNVNGFVAFIGISREEYDLFKEIHENEKVKRTLDDTDTDTEGD